MSCYIRGTTIAMTRGDSFNAFVQIYNQDGTPYEIQPGDSVRFALKKSYSDETPLLNIDIPTEEMVLYIAPEMTKPLSFGNYVYDMQIIQNTGVVDTFITKARFQIMEEVV